MPKIVGCLFLVTLVLAVRGGEQALEILKHYPEQKDWYIQRAIRWIHEHPQGLQGSADLLQRIQETSNLLFHKGTAGTEFRIEENQMIFDRQKTMVLVRCHLYGGQLSGWGYDMLFHNITGIWVLKGIWNTWIS